MWNSVAVVTKPTILPVTLSTVKKWLRVDHSDDDEIINIALGAAIGKVDGPTGAGLAMMAQTWRRTLPMFVDRIALPGWPVKAVSSITYLDGNGTRQTVASSNYVLDVGYGTASVFPAWGLSWPAERVQPGSVEVIYTLGENSAAEVPSDLITAVLMLTAHHYEIREAVHADGLAEIPLGVRSILDEYRRLFVA